MNQEPEKVLDNDEAWQELNDNNLLTHQQPKIYSMDISLGRNELTDFQFEECLRTFVQARSNQNLFIRSIGTLEQFLKIKLNFEIIRSILLHSWLLSSVSISRIVNKDFNIEKYSAFGLFSAFFTSGINEIYNNTRT